MSQESPAPTPPAIRVTVHPTPRPVHVPPGGPPQGAGPSKEIYARMGEANIFRMCRDFYAEIEHSAIRPMFSADLPEASKNLAAFLVGVCGGPPLFRQLRGEPMMRARHLPFAIDEKARRTWLDCFLKTLEGAEEKYAFPAEHLPGFKQFLDDFSGWMVNRR
jgi:hemoglobin